MTAEIFLDANVLLYASSNAAEDKTKRERAQALMIATPFATATVLPVSLELILTSVQIRRKFQVSHWDATIIAAAMELGCSTLYSEDLNRGQSYDGVRVVNPFVS